MPIGKVICSSSFADTSRYVLVKEKAKLLDGGTMISQNRNDLVWEFEQSRRNNPDINRPCLHMILSYSKEDERLQTLDNDLLAEISEEHFVGCAVLSRWHKPLKELDKNEYHKRVEEFKKTELHHYQFFSALHEDVHHRHTHLVGSRINTIDSKCLETWQNRIKSQYVIRDIEERYGLEINQSSWEKDRKGLSRRQLEKWTKTDIKPVQLELQEVLDETLKRVATVDELVKALEESGVDVQLHQQKSGQVYGVSYEKNGIAFRGSDLGKKYSFKGLERTLINQIKEIETDGQNRIKRSLETTRRTIAVQHSSNPAVIKGARKLRERRRTGQITAATRKLESTLNQLESIISSQQQITRAIADRVLQVEQEQLKIQQEQLEKNRQKQKGKGIEIG